MEKSASRLSASRMVAAFMALSAGSAALAAGEAPTGSWANSPIVQKIRAATAPFQDPETALGAGYIDTGNCVSGRDGGGMGIHFINPELLDGAVDVETPEVLIYEPQPNGSKVLVGVEYIALDDNNAETGSPVLDGHLLNYSGAPNRYGLPAFHELHVWAWKYNPDGTFSDWNPRVSCDAYEGMTGMGGH